jgi:Family of unknown function (DUF6169)
LQNPYKLKENDDYSYEFLTDQSIKYLVYFIDYNFMFYQYPSLAENIYTINIDVLEGDIEFTIEDERIGITVIEIFKIFFRNIENAVIYICDNNDNRHFTRKRKFDFWFNKYNSGSILKEDGIAIIEEIEILNSLLVSENHPKVDEIINAFKAINKTAGQK